jgi:hypothetical protein
MEKKFHKISGNVIEFDEKFHEISYNQPQFDKMFIKFCHFKKSHENWFRQGSALTETEPCT